jgi:hypothetical protein
MMPAEVLTAVAFQERKLQLMQEAATRRSSCRSASRTTTGRCQLYPGSWFLTNTRGGAATAQ